ncbi:MAG: CHAT domain-containing protein [Ignavibacteriaceae bacterium]|nr:CHAT domain-containing protein [Ignavibacteriaceae bacterium]
MQKLLILILLLVAALFHPAEENKDHESNNNSVSTLLDSIRVNVSHNRWNNAALYSYSSYLLNSFSLDINKENEEVKKLPASFEKTFLFALLCKRELKFKEMFDSLYSVLNNSPDYLYYYDELSFASSAANQQSFLKTSLDKNKLVKPGFRYYLLGLLNLSSGNSKEALNNLLQALKTDSLNSYYLYQVSVAYRNLGDYPQSIEALNKSIDNNVNDKSLNARIILARGSVYFLSGKTPEAEKYYNEALDASSSINDLQTKARALVNLAIIQDVKGNSIKARELFIQASETATGINDLDARALALSELGVSFSFTNNLIEAKHYYLNSYKLYKTLGNFARLSFLSDNIAKIYMNMFDYTSALKYYQEGIQFAGDNKRARILNLIGLADVYTNLSNYTKAIGYYKEAKELAEGINELSLKSEVSKGMGALNFNLDKFNDALRYFNSYEDLSKKNGYVYLEADAYHKIGICLMQLDSLKDSEKYLMTAENNARKSGDAYLDAICMTDLASLYLKANDNPKALELLTKAKTTAAKGNFNYLEALIGLIEGDISKDFEKAKSLYQTSLSLGKKINDIDIQIDACSALAKLFARNNLTEAADSYYSSAIDLVENISRPLFKSEDVQISYFSSKRDVYSSYAEFLLKQKKYEMAFNVIDKSRSRNLMQNLTNLKLQSLIRDENTLNRIYEYDWMIHSGIYNQNQLDSITIQYNLLKKDLISANKDLAPYLDHKTVMPVPEIQKNLNASENIVSVFSSENNTWLFLINKNKFRTFNTGLSKNDLKKMLSSISPYYRWEENTTTSFYNQDLFSFNAAASYELYIKLLKEALNEIPKQEKIIIVPSTELIVLPIDFLVSGYDNESSPYSYKDKHYLLYDYDVSYSTSASAFTEEKANHLSNSNKSLIVGDPLINTNSDVFAERRSLLDDNPGLLRNIALLPLKYSKEEVSSIGKIVNADKILTDKNATETNFKRNAPLKSIIHLSTHSFLFNKQPVIFFSNINDPYNDGFLEAGEIVQLTLNSDLVVLSSCNSGLGRIDESEGIIGMSKAFFEAGARSIVVSLWEVNDKYTSKFMTLFYQKLSDGLDKSEALRQAKIEFIKEYSPNPYYWGAFILSGDISTIPIEHNHYTFELIIVLIILTFLIMSWLLWKYYFRKIFSLNPFRLPL